MPHSRTVTVLVADVVGSTELLGRLGVDRADDARRALFTAFSAAIGAGHGVLIKTMGDGCLASFGSAADAVTAAVALQHAGARLRARKVPGLGLRVGVAVGDVTEEDGDVFGPAVVTASRLCDAAGEHQILATDMVRMLAGDRGSHRYETVGELLGLLGRHDDAVDALTAALSLEESVASPPFTARTRYWLARALLQRAGPGDRERADVELGRSIETAERLGMAGLLLAGRSLAEPEG